jgi:hypothetical protein
VARVDATAIANRVFETFLAPLVLGGEVRPGRPLGARAALAIGAEPTLTNIDLVAHVELARTRVARRLVPIDRVEKPTAEEWALGCALHDLVQAAHPGFDATFRRSGPRRLLGLVEATLERVSSPRSVGEGLSRHTWFSRLFQLERIDTKVSWWVGSGTFLGESPPTRLTAWPELRRVHVEKTPRTIMDLPAAGAAIDAAGYAEYVSSFLVKTPLTDLAHCHRPSPPFGWSAETLGFVATPPGRALAMRALADAPSSAVDASLGRATRALALRKDFKLICVALDLLAERALWDAEQVKDRGGSPPPPDAKDDAAYARCLGARVACEQLKSHGHLFNESDRAELLARLTPLASSPVTKAFLAEFSAANAPSPKRGNA